MSYITIFTCKCCGKQDDEGGREYCPSSSTGYHKWFQEEVFVDDEWDDEWDWEDCPPFDDES